jgi:hypothetical protein
MKSANRVPGLRVESDVENQNQAAPRAHLANTVGGRLLAGIHATGAY